MKRWRRSGGLGPGAQAAACHQVLSVTAVDDVAIWTFDGNISSVDDLTKFEIAATTPTSLDAQTLTTITFTYPTPDLSGQDWILGVGGLSFDDGKPACPGQAGTVS